MRALLLLALCACAPLEDAVARADAGCLIACPATCSSCLPAGYCATAETTAAALQLQTLPEYYSWHFVLTGFPPDAALSYRLHYGIDPKLRPPSVNPEWERFFGGIEGEAGVALNWEGEATQFPVWFDHAGDTETADGGNLEVALQIQLCMDEDLDGGLVQGACLIDPASTISAAVLDPGPWSQPPACP